MKIELNEEYKRLTLIPETKEELDSVRSLSLEDVPEGWHIALALPIGLTDTKSSKI